MKDLKLLTKFSIHKRSIIICIAIAVWTMWLSLLGTQEAISYLMDYWTIAVTMIFGSTVAGGTSLGGGAVAFPVFTKVLQISPDDAKMFSLAIQSIGMTSAAIAIILTGIRVDWRVIRWGSIGGAIGMALGATLLAPILPPDVIKMSFTVMLASFGVTLLALNRLPRDFHLEMPIWTANEQKIWLLAGMMGGIMSSLVGSGIDVFCFSVMVILFRFCERVATPTSVILMATNAVFGFAFHAFILDSFMEPVQSYWLAAIPVVVVGAPLGAMLCNLLNRQTIANILIGLICVEILSSLLLVHVSTLAVYSSLFAMLVFSGLNYWMYRTNIYQNDRA
ncbi:sulfite exporter TauE/SafE family protein [Roseofilum casamattae]|uniref:Probable membrane transporter protein n=1 Tax=Roseofilum casamattae BLCC-M143 TaxID=3022442 RepID=A0ABT7BWA8_9CYAN|nr:sulfite exporter TauE/SafE family protein [Roseofilum casamattae]MDJ1183365.1 sulfite exporter TauE/SafE family protein [Roseofilum casamattae BLCC-M143]